MYNLARKSISNYGLKKEIKREKNNNWYKETHIRYKMFRSGTCLQKSFEFFEPLTGFCFSSVTWKHRIGRAKELFESKCHSMLVCLVFFLWFWFWFSCMFHFETK